MTVQAQTNINAYREEAVRLLAEVGTAQGCADVAVQNYVDHGGKRSDVIPEEPKPEKVKLAEAPAAPKASGKKSGKK